MPKPEFRSQEEIISEIIRVNHAGEYGAVQIYKSQLNTLKDQKQKNIIQHMLEQEQKHLEFFEQQIKDNNIRPTIMLPIWKILGSILGKAPSNKIAMMVTESIETMINQHYKEQINYLNTQPEYKELQKTIEKFRQEEMEHHDIAVQNGSKSAPIYNILNYVVKKSCKLAIKISKKI